ncbi:glycosyltransferase family protein [Thiobacillus denitrificans]|uniref:glycosyltransferase family protein n=1 Tax=Thiobacillus denitrificans TaxID=36861 RepID=UPI0003A09C86|nr:glycosyltransferase [Thiobacillus denitrificans]
MKHSLRLFYLPNEGTEGDQVGPRRAFERALAEGKLGAYQAYSYLVRDKALGGHRRALEDLLNAAREFSPDVIFVQHMNNTYPADPVFFQKLKATPSKPKLVVWEGDPYGQIVKPLDSTLKAVMGASDLAFLVGLGYLAEAARKAGASRIRFSHNSYDDERFGLPWEPTRQRPLDAVMIANLHSIKRIPGLYLPGGRQRKQLANTFHNMLGDRFAVYGGGAGWRGKPYARGSIPYVQQRDMTRSAWMSISWDHFPGLPMNSSDRLVISLSNGVPFLTNHQRGYEVVYGGIPGLYWFHSPQEAVDIALYLLSMPVEKRIELGMAAAEHMRRHFHADRVYGDILEIIQDELFSERETGLG